MLQKNNMQNCKNFNYIFYIYLLFSNIIYETLKVETITPSLLMKICTFSFICCNGRYYFYGGYFTYSIFYYFIKINNWNNCRKIPFFFLNAFKGDIKDKMANTLLITKVI